MAQISLNIGDGSARCGNIDNGFNSFYISDEDAPIMRWLFPLEPNNRHQGVRKERWGRELAFRNGGVSEVEM